MSEPADPRALRIGDAERDRAAELLREHLAQGRLRPEEFDERLDRALRARTAPDLAPLFDDLPGPRPATEMARVDDHLPASTPLAQVDVNTSAPWWGQWWIVPALVVIAATAKLVWLIPIAIMWVWWIYPSYMHPRVMERRRREG